MLGLAANPGQWLPTTGTSASLEARVVGDGEPIARGGNATARPR
jgi:hypothetical protein